MAWTAADITAVEDAIRALISGEAVQSYSIGGRNVNHMTLAQLQAQLDRMRADIETETAGGLPGLGYGVPTKWGEKGGNP